MIKAQETKRGGKTTGTVETLRHKEAKCRTRPYREVEERSQKWLWGPCLLLLVDIFYSYPKHGHLALTMDPDDGAAGGSTNLTFVPPTIL